MNKLFSLAAVAALSATMLSSCCQSGADCNSSAASRKEAALENIMTRTSIRKYDAQPVSESDVETMLRAGMAAPSAMNRQPWDFVVVDDKATLDTLASKLKRAPIANGCPLVIVVCGNLEKAGDGNRFWDQDASAATENILLAAHAIGLGAVWCGGYPLEDRAQAVGDALNLPSYVKPLSIICIGHPAENPEPKDKWKPENVHRNKF